MTAANNPKLEGLEAGSYLTAMDNHLAVTQLQMLNTLLLTQTRTMGRLCHCLSDDLLDPPILLPQTNRPITACVLCFPSGSQGLL